MSELDMEILRQVDLCWGMNDREIALLHGIASQVHCKAGDVIFREGEECDSFYIVIDGLVEIVTELADKGNKVLGEVHAGRQFGEMALIDNEPRSATSIARVDSRLYVVLRDRFLDLIEREPIFAAKALINLARTLSNRLRTTNHALRESIDWNLKVSGAIQMGLGALIKDRHTIKLYLRSGKEIVGLPLQIEKSAAGHEMVIEESQTGKIFLVPYHAIECMESSH